MFCKNDVLQSLTKFPRKKSVQESLSSLITILKGDSDADVNFTKFLKTFFNRTSPIAAFKTSVLGKGFPGHFGQRF